MCGPQVHACDPAKAATIYDNTKLGVASVDFPAIKAAFESCYEFMNVTCADIGGFWDKTSNDYYTNAGPCVDSTTAAGDETPIIAASVVGGGVALILVLCICFLICREKKGQPSRQATHDACPYRAPSTRRTAHPMHRVWHRQADVLRHRCAQGRRRG